MARSRSSFSLDAFPPVTLEQLDERAALLKRTDHKYVVDGETFERLLAKLAADHAVLEIDGRRQFGYQSVYFDTPSLRCFREHVQDRSPRFKARTRLYRDTHRCVFEVKLKLASGETDKRQVEHPFDAPEQLTDQARESVEQALEQCGMEPLSEPLEPSLRTTFTRATLAPTRAGAERTTCDSGIFLDRLAEKGRARLKEGLVVVEAKSENGDSPADRALQSLGAEPISLSKYRTGIALLVPRAEDPESPRQAERFFEVESS
jgi:hypothetical protein